MAPEQTVRTIESDPELTNVFGLGAVLYFVLTGEAPFDSASTAESLARARECRFKDPEASPRGKELPGLCRIVRKGDGRGPSPASCNGSGTAA